MSASTFRIALLLVSAVVGSTGAARAQASANLRDFLDGPRDTAPADPEAIVRIVGPRGLVLREFTGIDAVGSLYVPETRIGNSTTPGHVTPILRRRYLDHGVTGGTVALRLGRMELSVDRLGQYTSHVHESRAYVVEITEHVVALHLDYVDRHRVRVRRGLLLLGAGLLGGALMGMATIDSLQGDARTMNKGLAITGGLGIALSIQLMVWPVFTRDGSRIAVEYADGRVEVARRRVRN